MGNSLTFFFAEKENWAKKPSQLFFCVYRDWKDAPTKPRSEKALFLGCSSAASFSPPLVRLAGDANAKEGRKWGWAGGETRMDKFRSHATCFADPGWRRNVSRAFLAIRAGLCALSRHAECGAAESRYKYLQERGRWRWTHALVHLEEEEDDATKEDDGGGRIASAHSPSLAAAVRNSTTFFKKKFASPAPGEFLPMIL